MLPHAFRSTLCSVFVLIDVNSAKGSRMPDLDHIRGEIERMRVQVGRQRKEILSLQRAGIATGSAEALLERMRARYSFFVAGYVVMPEHVHLLLSEPDRGLLADGLQGLKLSVVRRAKQNPFWQRRYYDFNVFTEAKRIQKLGYMHWNPVKRGLVERPEDWPWSSCRFYQTGEPGRVSIDSSWRDPVPAAESI